MNALPSWGVDARLVRRTLAGNNDAFCRLVERHLPAVEAIALSCTRNWADAEDVSQEAFLKAYQSLDTLRERSKFGPWVASIARNAGLRMASRETRNVPLSEAQQAKLFEPATDFARTELLQVLHAHVLNMPEESREVLLLHYYGGQSLREVAAALDISREAATKRLQRGREALSAAVLRALGESPPPQRRRARARQLAAVTVAGSAAWQAGAASAATLAVSQAGFFAAVLKPTVVASTITATAFVGFLSYVAIGARHADGGVSAPRELANTITASQPATAAIPVAQTRVDPEKAPRPTTGPGSITVTVSAGKGATGAGATVTVELVDWPAFTYPPSELVIKELVADDSGVARFTNLPLGEYGIVATLGNLIWGDGVVLDKNATHADSPLQLRPGVPFDGIVVDAAGTPVPRAAIYPHSSPWISYVPWGLFGALRMVSDENGIIHRDVLPQAPLQYCIVAEGYAPTLTGTMTHGKNQLQMVVQKGGAFSGVVVDSQTGNAVPGISLRIEGQTAIRQMNIESNETGVFSSPPLQPGVYQLRVIEDGYADAGAVSVEVIEGEVASDVKVAVLAGGIISGAVRNSESGDGIAGATVVAYADGRESRSSQPSDASGAYVIFGLGQADYTIHASAEGYFPDSSERVVSAAPGEEAESIDFSLTRGYLVRGRVLEASGQPATSAYIYKMDETSASNLGRLAKTENDNGAFTFLLPRDSEPIWLKAYALYGSSADLVPIDITDDDTYDVVLRASRPRSAGIEGTIVNAAGAPLPFAFAWAIMETDTGVNPVLGKEIFADQSGHFSVTGLHPHIYHLVAGFDNRDHAQTLGVAVDVRDGHVEHGVEVVLGQSVGPMIAGRVTGSDRKPISGAEITVQSPSYGRFTTDSAGQFNIPRTMTGDYLLKVAHANYSSVYLDPLPGDQNAIAVVLQDRASLEGRIVDADTGKPVERFEMFQQPSGCRNELQQFRTFTATDGAFKLGRAESGLSMLHVRADGYQANIVELDLPPSSTKTGVEIRMLPGGAITGTVVTSDGEPVENAEVFVGQSFGNAPQALVQTTTNARGEFRLSGLPLEAIEITAMHYAHARATISVTPQRDQTAPVIITLPETGELDVMVKVNGAPEAGAFITAFYPAPDTSAGVGAVTEASGYARIGNITQGAYKLIAQTRIGNGMTWHVASSTASIELGGPDREVVFDVAIGSGVVAGTVQINGQPVSGEMIAAQSGNGQLLTYSQSDGSFRLEGLPAGEITISSGPDLDHLSPRTSIRVEDGQAITLDIAL